MLIQKEIKKQLHQKILCPESDGPLLYLLQNEK
jgi:hypothetical protein